MPTFSAILLSLAALSLVTYGLGVLCAWLHIRRSRPATLPEGAYPPVTLLKPVKGVEERMEECLETFLAQDYPGELEVVFAAAHRDDPALAVARKLAARYPHVTARFVLTDENWGFNPKVSNMQGGLQAASHDLVLQSDANVRVAPNYLRRIVAEFVSEDGSLLSSVVSGIGEQSAGAAMENLQLSAFTAPACCTALKLAGIPCVIGKSILFRKSELQALGGLELFKDSLAEDFLLGRHYMDHGRKVILSSTPIQNVNVQASLERHINRHGRWLKMRAVIHVPGFIADLLANPVAMLAFACAASGFEPRLLALWVGVALAKIAIDRQLVKLVRGEAMQWRWVVLSPVKDMLMSLIWLHSIFSRTIEWRGVKLRMGADSRLQPWEATLPERVLRRLLNA